MVRNVFTCLLAGATLCVTPAGVAGTARGQGAKDGSEVSSLSLGQLILRENFDDNVQGPMWGVYAEDSNSCWVTETNGRLELQTKGGGSGKFAAYVSNGWQLDPSHSFSLRVDLHYELVAQEKGQIAIGLTPEAGSPLGEYVIVAAGCVSFYSNFSYTRQDRTSSGTEFAPRFETSSTVYLSYDAGQDTLYLSRRGYGPENAWVTITELLQEEWDGQPLSLILGGSVYGPAVASGQIYADNLLVESGTVIETVAKPVYRFWSGALDRHFYTISELEKEKLLTTYAKAWKYEGIAYHAFAEGADLLTAPVYRFWSNQTGGHFYTISAREKSKLIKDYPAAWTFEGVAFYAYPKEKPPVGSLPVYRFWSASKNAHFYTISETEKDNLIRNYSQVWTYEGVAWHALE